jgi:predicted aspartyl protease
VIVGTVSSALAPTVKLALVGVGPHEIEIEFDVDTGFTRGLTLPLRLILALDWPYHQNDVVTLGDGTKPIMDFYRGIVMWHGQPRLVDVLAAESKPLVGTGLLDGNELKIQFKRGGSVSISQLP